MTVTDVLRLGCACVAFATPAAAAQSADSETNGNDDGERCLELPEERRDRHHLGILNGEDDGGDDDQQH